MPRLSMIGNPRQIVKRRSLLEPTGDGSLTWRGGHWSSPIAAIKPRPDPGHILGGGRGGRRPLPRAGRGRRPSGSICDPCPGAPPSHSDLDQRLPGLARLPEPLQLLGSEVLTGPEVPRCGSRGRREDVDRLPRRRQLRDPQAGAGAAGTRVVCPVQGPENEHGGDREREAKPPEYSE